MSDQLNLFGSDGGASPPDDGHRGAAKKPRQARKPFKLFFALLPAAAAATEIWRRAQYLDQAQGIHGQPLRSDRLHITLHVIGEYDEPPHADVLAARRAGDAMDAYAFDVVFDRAMTFVGPRAYVLRVGEGGDRIEDFWLKLGIEIANVLPFKPQPFTPHMTLSYNGKPMAEHAIEPIHCRAWDLVLINSHVGRTHHEVMGRWPLANCG